MTRRPAVLLLSGSPNPGSRVGTTVAAAARLLAERGAHPRVWDLAERPLPVVDPRWHGRPDAHPAAPARALAKLAQEADAFVLASPTYHGSFSGVVKNALDHLDVPALAGKPVGLVAHGENLSAVQVCDGLRSVVRALHGLALPEQLVTVPGDFAPGVGGERELRSAAARERLGRLCAALLDLTRRLGASADPVPASGVRP